MLVKNIILLSIFILYSSFSVLICQTNNQKFEHLTVDYGLSNNFISDIAQDSSGFMWFATEDGLNKYNGYDFTVYRHDPNDSKSLSENNIKVLQVDKNGILWIGTIGGGLNAFDPKTEKFIRFNMDPDDREELIYDMYLDKKGLLWISVQGKGLYCLDPGTKKITHYAYNPDGSNTISTNVGLTITGTVENGKETLWVGSWGGGLNKFDPEKKGWTHYWYDPNNRNSLSSNYITKVYADKSGLVWVITGQKGIDKLDTKTEHFTNYRHDPENPNSLSGNMAKEVIERDGILWITTMSGLSRLNIKKGEFKSWLHNPSDPHSISQNSLNPVFESKGGLMWIGGWSGIDIIDLKQKPFCLYQHQPGNPNSLSDNFICAILETRRNENALLWAGTKDGGLNKIARRTGSFTHYRHNASDPNSLSNNFIFSITESFYEGKLELWLGSLNGLNRFDPQTEKFTHYYCDPDDTTSVSENYIYKVYRGRDGSIWIGTTNRGICRYNPDTQKFRRYKQIMATVWVIHEDSLGFIWHSTMRSGLVKLDPLTGQIKRYAHDQQNLQTINSNTIRCIHESAFKEKHTLWIGTNGGLSRFDYETETFHRYTRKDGLPSDEINGILEDKQGNLWLSTGLGLTRFDPVSGKIRNYDKDDGLPGNQFLRGGYFQAENGEMFFGSTNGFTSFFPEQIKDNLYIPEIVLTDFKIFNKSVPVKKDGPVREEDYFLPAHISAIDEIELAYDQSVFSFEFAALDFRKPQKNQYAYMMEGVDPEWVYTDASRRFATYTNLDPGEYIFRVKGSNNDGIWNEAGTSIRIIIAPPWWETQIAYIFYFIFFIAVIAGTWRFQTGRLKMKQQMQIQRFEADKLREVDQMKSHFFTNISHEFRTPLTLIKGPVKQIMDGTFTGNLKEQCKMILRNSDRLLGLITQILDLSRLESGEMKLKVAETDITKFIKGMVLTFSPLAETKKVNLKFSGSENSLIGYVDLDKLEKILTNLLSNAFKFTPEGGVVEVAVNSGRSSDKLRPAAAAANSVKITISNTGPGIPTNQMDKIFDRFYSAQLDKKSLNNRNADDDYPTGQADNNYKKDLAPLDNEGNAIQTLGRHTYPTGEQGTGIGLALTKELVETCHGEISVSSIPEESTTFKVKLPIAKENFKEEEIIEVTPQISPLSGGQTGLAKGGLRGVSIPDTDTAEVEQELKFDTKKSAPLLLIVEDNPDVTNYIRSFMEQDYRILTAENGKEGLKYTLDKYPDLVISDVMMPEMDGFELCKKIKTNERISHIPVILLTAKADLDSKIEGLEFGADDYVTKPFEARELQIRAKNLIEQRRKLREKFSALIDLNPADIAASSMDEQLLKRLLNIFEDHMEKPEFSIKLLAHEIGMSRRHLNRKIHAITNLSTSDFIRTLRLQRAAGMLRNDSGTVTEIAYKVGFNNLSHFSKTFRKHFGKLPSEFTKE